MLTVWLRSNLSSIIRAEMLECEMLTLTTPSGSRENCSPSAAVTQPFSAAKSAAMVERLRFALVLEYLHHLCVAGSCYILFVQVRGKSGPGGRTRVS